MANTFISRVWINNSNTIIISDDPARKEEALSSMIERGGRLLDSYIMTHNLGEVIVLRSKATKEST